MKIALAILLSTSIVWNWLFASAWLTTYDRNMRYQSLAQGQEEELAKATSALGQCLELYIQAR